MPLDGKMVWFAIPIFIGFVAVEMLTLRYFGRSGYSWRESLATIGVQKPEKVDAEKVKASLPHGQVTVKEDGCHVKPVSVTALLETSITAAFASDW